MFYLRLVFLYMGWDSHKPCYVTDNLRLFESVFFLYLPKIHVTTYISLYILHTRRQIFSLLFSPHGSGSRWDVLSSGLAISQV